MRARRGGGGRRAQTAWGVPPAIGPEQAGVARSALRMPEAFSALAAPPLFITGTGRSGKSMTLDLFTRHPEVCTVFESWLLTPQSGITGVFHQPQWDDAFYAGQVERVGHEHAARAVVSYARAAADLGDVLSRWLMARVGPGQRFLVEKTPVDVEALAAMFPGARLVHMIRDGRDVAGSVAAAARSWAPEMGRGTLGEHAAGWDARVRELRRGAALLGEGYLEVRFEDQRADPEGVARRLFDFAGIPYDDALIAAALAAIEPQSYSQAARASGFRGSGRVGGWRDRMTRAQGREFDEAAGDLLVELGYAADRRWWRELPRRRPRS